MFGVSGFELFIVVAFALIIFGPDKLPQMAATISKFMRDFNRTREQMEEMIRAETEALQKGDLESAAAKMATKAATGSEDSIKDQVAAATGAADWMEDEDDEEDEE